MADDRAMMARPGAAGPWTIVALWLLATLLLLWPAAAHRQAALFYDTPGYVSTGEAGLQWGVGKVKALFGDGAAPSAGKSPADADGVVSTRSLSYSLLAGLTAGPQREMVATVIVHAAIVGGVVLMLWTTLAPMAGAAVLAGALAGLALASSAAWFASFAMPDVLAGVLLLALAMLAALDLRGWQRAVLVLLAGFAIAAHASHLLLAAAVVAVITADALWRRRWRGAGFAGLAVVLGAGATLALSVVGLREASLAPKRLPFALARSIEDGPARWYLEANCARERYVICGFFPVMPRSSTEVLFGPTGVNTRATPAQMAAIRDEEMAILERTARAYPLAQAMASTRNFGRQLISVGLVDLAFDKRIMDSGDRLVLQDTGAREWDRRPFHALIIVSALAALGWLALRWRGLSSTDRTLVVVMLAGLLANAAITGVLSAVAERYQSRVLWVLPAIAMGLWLARRQAKPTAA